MEFLMIDNTRGIAHERTNRKDDIFLQIRLYIDEAHTALDIFRFAVFFHPISQELNLGLIVSQYGAKLRPHTSLVVMHFRIK